MSFSIALAQIDVIQAEPELNLQKAGAFIRQASLQGCKLICFPEMWTTGFNWEINKKLLQQQQTIKKELAALAQKHNITIMGSILDQNDNGAPINNFLVFDESGNIKASYGKTHLFTLFDEQLHLNAGNSLVQFEAQWGTTGLAVCYDLRFPELFRSYALHGVDIVFLPAAFPYPRLEHWQTLIKARAIENQFYMVAVNQAGSEVVNNKKVTYFGSSAVIDPWGETVAAGKEAAEDLIFAEIDIENVNKVRSMIPVFRDRRPELYRE